ncbi:hypothetical protein USB125703_00586 [Pseudoclavibacter triregionum]|nr:hypothetical protein USB125703_00586 [Pseudoclavibacter triregionum]
MVECPEIFVHHPDLRWRTARAVISSQRGLRMGRGRQKAKHTKVARELKYSVPETDYDKLQRELGVTGSHDSQGAPVDELSKWAEYLDDEDDAEDDGYEPIAHQKLA